MRDICTFEHEGIVYRIPKTLASGRYHVTGVLARGGMGVLYTALDTLLNRKNVLVKSLLYKPSIFAHRNDVARVAEIQKCREQMRCEKVALQYIWERGLGSVPVLLDAFEDYNPMLEGPHVDRDTGETFVCTSEAQNDPYLVISYVEGVPLQHPRARPQQPDKVHTWAKKIFLSIAKILQELHRPYRMTLANGQEIVLECVYCDLKPGNILYTPEKTPVLIDFGGMVKKVDGQLQDAIVSTPGYCAPEINEQLVQTILPEDVAPAVDVYSMGATLYELLSGQPPAVQYGRNVFDFSSIQRNFPKWTGFLQKALEEIPQNRFSSMAEMIEGFYSMVEGIQPGAPKKIETYKRKEFKPLSAPVLRIPGWDTVRETSNNLFLHANLQRREGNFLLNAHAIFSSADYIRNVHLPDISPMERDMLFPAMKNHFENLVQLLSQNKTYLPELLAQHIGDQDVYFVYKARSGKKIKFFLPEINYLYKRLSRILAMFVDMQKSGMAIAELGWDNILFDQSDAPSLKDPTRLVRLVNPDQAFSRFFLIGSHLYDSAPEIVQQNRFLNTTYSYLTGRLLLNYLARNQKNSQLLPRLHQNGLFPSKETLETWVPLATQDPVLQKFLVHALAPEPKFRARLEDLRALLANGDLPGPGKTGATHTHNKVLLKGYSISLLCKIRIDYNKLYNYIAGLRSEFKILYTQVIITNRNPQPESDIRGKELVVDPQISGGLQRFLEAHASTDVVILFAINRPDIREQCFRILDMWAPYYRHILVFTDVQAYFSSPNVTVFDLGGFLRSDT